MVSICAKEWKRSGKRSEGAFELLRGGLDRGYADVDKAKGKGLYSYVAIGSSQQNGLLA